MRKALQQSQHEVAQKAAQISDFFRCSSGFTEISALQQQQLLLSFYADSKQEDLPEEVQALRAQHALAVIRRTELSLRLQHELEDIQLLHLKGAAFNLRYYGALAARDFEDVDLLVHAADVEAVQARLQHAGLRRTQSLSHFAERSERRSQHALEFIDEESGIEVDLHWCLAQRQFALPDFSARLWERSEQQEVEGVLVRVPAPIDTLTALLVGAAKDSWRSLRALLDIERCLVQVAVADLDAEYVRFASHGCGLIFLAPLALLARIFPHSPQHAWVLERNSATLERTVDMLEGYCGRMWSERAELRIQLAMRTSIAAKLRYTFGRMCIPHREDWEMGLGVLTYLYKPIKTSKRALWPQREL